MKYKIRLHYFIFILLLSCQSYQKDNTSNSELLVDISEINSHIILDIRYATENNFLHRKLYPVAKCYLRESVARKLDSVQTELEKMGLGLKIFDGYRPLSVQKKMWEILPDDRYVANPKYGSRHNRGAAVDLTLVDSTGKELLMPTAFDDFTEKASHTYDDLPPDAIQNRTLLRCMMEKYGFMALESEWWHYDIKNYMDYDILDLDFFELEKAGMVSQNKAKGDDVW